MIFAVVIVLAMLVGWLTLSRPNDTNQPDDKMIDEINNEVTDQTERVSGNADNQAGSAHSDTLSSSANQPSRKFPSADRLEDLYDILDNENEFESWPNVLYDIASFGKSRESSRKLIEYIHRSESEQLPAPILWVLYDAKVDSLMLLGYTAGSEAEALLKETFLSESEPPEISRNWIDSYHQVTRMNPEYAYLTTNVIRSRAALGMLLIGDPALHAVVLDEFELLSKDYSSPDFSEQPKDLTHGIADALALYDASKKFGKNLFLVPGFGDSHVVQATIEQRFDHYMSKVK